MNELETTENGQAAMATHDDGWVPGWSAPRDNPGAPQGLRADAPPEEVGPSELTRGGLDLEEVFYIWGLSPWKARAVELILTSGDLPEDRQRPALENAMAQLRREIAMKEKFGARQ